MLATIALRPGIQADTTDYGAEGGWADGNRVRFLPDGSPEPVGGWEKRITAQLTGVPRAMHGWVTLSGQKAIAVATHSGLYVIYGGAPYDVTPDGLAAGLASATQKLGWGAGTWGRGTWGTPRASSGIIEPLRTWTLDNWGEDVLACPKGGSIYRWQPSAGIGGRAVALPNAPAAEAIIVDAENRIAIALGAVGSAIADGGGPLTIAWSAQEDLTDWTASATDQAGDQRLLEGSRIVGGVRGRGEILVWTDAALYAMTYIGPPLVYGFRRIGAADIAGPAAMVDLGGVVYWMGNKGWYAYNGEIQRIPSTVEQHAQGLLDAQQVAKVTSGTCRAFGEVYWFLPSTASSPGEVDRYVCLNPSTGVWTHGELDRSAWIDAGDVSAVPVGASPDGYVYDHETGATADGDPLGDWLESGDVDLGDGDRVAHLRRIVPDLSWPVTGSMTITVKTRFYPADTPTSSSAYTVTPDTRKLDTRATGRTLALRLDGVSGRWRLGRVRADFVSGGQR